jgi:uncharacterized protein YeaO (DUF488 family)
MIKLKRIYEQFEKEDGYRVLVDRLWPRGVSKETAHIDLWLKEIAPSDVLRKWFHHAVENWSEFKHRYLKELEKKSDLINQLKSLEKEHKVVTLLYGAKDTEHNQAVIILDELSKK